jgi:hypothetical protein
LWSLTGDRPRRDRRSPVKRYNSPYEPGYEIQKNEPTTAEGEDPFEKYRGSAESDETMPERMRRLRGEYPRDVDDETDDDDSEVET